MPEQARALHQQAVDPRADAAALERDIGDRAVCEGYKDPMKVFFIVTGPLIWLDENGASAGHFDVHDYIAMCRAHYVEVGLGAEKIDALFR